MEDSPITESKPFEIGLVLAGAVSAGAYTAGVMDYLLEVLEAWEQAKAAGQQVPGHGVVIKVMTGASAGGMTMAMAAIEMLRRANDPQASSKAGYRSLPYQAWVEKIDITHLLKTRDLQQGPLKSLLDSTIIEEIANEVIDVDSVPPWKPVSFIDKKLKLYLTLGNLRGLPYEFKLTGETGLPYGMTDHADYQYVEINSTTPKGDWIKLRNAAIATGAFPVGLSSRLIRRDTDEYKKRVYKDGRAISGLMKIDKDENEPYNFVAVDGGMLNNEPLELARSVWERFTETDKARIHSAESLDAVRQEVRSRVEKNSYALVMIDPFPDQASLGEDATPEDTALVRILGPLVGALRAQSLFKIEELLRAGDQDSDDRFLIAPIRYWNTGAKAKNAIACGFLGGFGGFLAREFREHDYQLGRRNCQRFLQKYFVLEEDEARERGWDVRGDYLVSDSSGKSVYPIIPIVPVDRLRQPQGEHNPWPEYKKIREQRLKAGLKARVRGLMKKILPFGWVDSGWSTITMAGLVLLVVAGEYVKALGNSDAPRAVLGTLRNGYIFLFQVALFTIFLTLLVLRIGKVIIERKLVARTFRLLMSQIRNWGIHQE